ncbi:hypothetical protein E2C01_097113 [Portunus trituberculatus]|uniref:Uncharacterized protein n=1 Tax=Portunus trituberculatus TaxID=210409 RepID=A0A5B7K941_PORTR|nr:hypothetical protein [Portunus trituberculatus]
MTSTIKRDKKAGTRLTTTTTISASGTYACVLMCCEEHLLNTWRCLVYWCDVRSAISSSSLPAVSSPLGQGQEE